MALLDSHSTRSASGGLSLIGSTRPQNACALIHPFVQFEHSFRVGCSVRAVRERRKEDHVSARGAGLAHKDEHAVLEEEPVLDRH